MNNKYGLIKYACYTTGASMSVVATLSPLLFLTFRNLYDISFSLLGALVFINFCTQLLVDLILSFYSHKFNISKLVKITPALTAAGLIIYFSVYLPERGLCRAGYRNRDICGIGRARRGADKPGDCRTANRQPG